MLPRLMKNNLREHFGGMLKPLLAVSKKVLPDCEKAGRDYLEVYFLDFLISFSYEELGGGYEKIGKIDEQI